MKNGTGGKYKLLPHPASDVILGAKSAMRETALQVFPGRRCFSAGLVRSSTKRLREYPPKSLDSVHC